MYPYASNSIDIQVAQLLSMSKSLLKKYKREELEEQISSAFLKDRSQEQLMTNLCVRSSLDLIL